MLFAFLLQNEYSISFLQVQSTKYIKEVNFSVVDEINEKEIQESKELAESMNIPLRVRHKN